jgi:hypothetical protein
MIIIYNRCIQERTGADTARTEFIYHTYCQLANTSLYNLRGCVSRELASKAYYKVKTVVWTPFWPSGTADMVACQSWLGPGPRSYSKCGHPNIKDLTFESERARSIIIDNYYS